MGSDAPTQPTDDLAALRRRLYAPDVTEQDVARYAAALALKPAPRAEAVEVLEVSPPAPTTRPGHRRAALVIAGAVLIAAAAVTALVVPRPIPAPAPTTPAGTLALTIPASARAAFARSLQAGNGASLAAYIFEHPDARPPQLTTLTRAATEEHHGTGGATISLGPTAEANQGGHITVILTVGTATTATWRAARIALDRVQQIAARTGPQPAGLPCSATIAYAGRPATLLSVSVPRGTRWDAVVVFSN